MRTAACSGEMWLTEPCSIEGVLNTRLPLWYHLIGLLEILLQILTFSIWLVWWEHQSQKSKEPST